MRNAVVGFYIQRVSTRRAKRTIDTLSGEEIFPQTVSKIAKELDEKVEKFLNRPIEFVNAGYYKVRDEIAGRYKTQTLLIVVGARKTDNREILGMKLAKSEREGFWLEEFEGLKKQGLRGVKLVISDGHKGIGVAVKKAFLGSSWQMCHVHFVRDVMKKVPKKRWK